MYQINTSTPTTFSNILIHSSELITYTLIEHAVVLDSMPDINNSIDKYGTKAVIYSDGSYSTSLSRNMRFDKNVNIGFINGSLYTYLFKFSSDSLNDLKNYVIETHFTGTWNIEYALYKGLMVTTNNLIPMLPSGYYIDWSKKKYNDWGYHLLTSDVKLIDMNDLTNKNDGTWKLYEEHYRSKKYSHTHWKGLTYHDCSYGDIHCNMMINKTDDSSSMILKYRICEGQYYCLDCCGDGDDWACTQDTGLVDGHYTYE